MICSTSFFNKTALLAALLLSANLCQSRKKRETDADNPCNLLKSQWRMLSVIAFCGIINLWGCARNQTELVISVPQPKEMEQVAEPAGEKTAPSIHRGMRITVLPMENLSAINAPLEDIGNSISLELEKNGFRVVNRGTLEQFRKKHRMRYTGGVNSALSEAMLKELGADAVLITSLEAYHEEEPPQISLIARLVSCGPQPEIIWIDSVGLSGDESPGLLDLNLIRSPGELLRKAVGILTDSLTASFDKETQDGKISRPSLPDSWKATGPEPLTWPGYRLKSKYLPSDYFRSPSLPDSWEETGPEPLISPGYRLNRKYLPYDYFRSPLIDPGRKYSIAVLPMLDLAGRKNSGIIGQLHYVRELFNLTDYKVIEPGLVREDLLRIRAIMPQGPSLAETDLITGKELLGVDLVLSGKVFDYQNASNNPKVDISVQVIEKNSRQVVFGARIFNTGLDRVFFYNFGREYTAHNLLKEISRITVQLLANPYKIEEQDDEEIIAHHPPLKKDEIKSKSDS
jgi:hypothetical protein